jgi:hypothetical protein
MKRIEVWYYTYIYRIYICIYIKTAWWNLSNTIWKRLGREKVVNGTEQRDEFVQSTLSTSVELSQWNPLLLLRYTNEKNVCFMNLKIPLMAGHDCTNDIQTL